MLDSLSVVLHREVPKRHIGSGIVDPQPVISQILRYAA